MRLVILGNGEPVKTVVETLVMQGNSVISVEQDKSLDSQAQRSFEEYLRNKNIGLGNFNTLKEGEYDLILVVNYNRIIPKDFLENKLIVNIHMGLLPKYRGNNANACSVLNSEQSVGYTIHRVNEILDGGDILYRFAYPYLEGQTYNNAKTAIWIDIKNNLSLILERIVEGRVLPISQKNQEFVYSSRLRPSDGLIRNWNMTTDELMRKFYIFGQPAGTGVKFMFKEKIFEIVKLSKIPNYGTSRGIRGSVVYIENGSLWVKSKDSAISLDQISLDGNLISPKKYFRIGDRL